MVYQGYVTNLHSIMYLLIHNPFADEEFSEVYLHSIMYLLIRLGDNGFENFHEIYIP